MVSADTIGFPAASSSNDTFLTTYTLDNLSEVTETKTYNNNHYNASNGAPVAGMILTADSTAGYDNQGNVFSTAIISVDPGQPDNGATITTNDYYDADGNLIAAVGQTGAATKYTFNGAGWETASYVTDGGQLNNASNVSIGSSNAYSSATSVSGDIVLTQAQNSYDNDGNVIETISKDRLSTDGTSNSSTGALGTSTTGVNARVSYSASYYDAADRDIEDVNVGTNGGSA